MIVVGAKKIRGNVHVFYPKLVFNKCTISISQTGFSVTYRFNFSAEKLYAGYHSFHYLVVERCPFVFDEYVGAFSHNLYQLQKEVTKVQQKSQPPFISS
jgi:hypothetical protein